MAQPVHCDMQGTEAHLADVLVSMIANGDTSAWCFTHYLDVCQAALDTATEAAAFAASQDQEAVDRLAGATPGPGEATADETAQAAPTAPAEPTGPDGGPSGEAGDQPDQAGLGGRAAGREAEPQPTA